MTVRPAATAVLVFALAATACADTGERFGGIGSFVLDGAQVPLS